MGRPVAPLAAGCCHPQRCPCTLGVGWAGPMSLEAGVWGGTALGATSSQCTCEPAGRQTSCLPQEGLLPISYQALASIPRPSACLSQLPFNILMGQTFCKQGIMFRAALETQKGSHCPLLSLHSLS